MVSGGVLAGQRSLVSHGFGKALLFPPSLAGGISCVTAPRAPRLYMVAGAGRPATAQAVTKPTQILVTWRGYRGGRWRCLRSLDFPAGWGSSRRRRRGSRSQQCGRLCPSQPFSPPGGPELLGRAVLGAPGGAAPSGLAAALRCVGAAAGPSLLWFAPELGRVHRGVVPSEAGHDADQAVGFGHDGRYRAGSLAQ